MSEYPILSEELDNADSSQNAIEIKDLTKQFGSFIAVNNISLNIKKGEIFGLLGPNGAGKTTTISMLATLLKPTSGHATIWNIDVSKNNHDVRQMIGIVFQDPSLDDELTGRENLDFHGRMYNVEKDTRKKRIQEVLELVELTEKADHLVRTYSGGMKRRLEIARGLLHYPKVLFLDEPTIGLDPQTRRKLWEYIKKLNEREHITIILTTHYMDEADELCDRIAIVDHGKIIALDTPANLKQTLGGDSITLQSPDSERLNILLGKTRYVKDARISASSEVSFTVVNGGSVLPSIMELAQKNKIAIRSIVLKTPNLEDVFIHYTGRNMRDQEAGSGEDMKKLAAMMRR